MQELGELRDAIKLTSIFHVRLDGGNGDAPLSDFLNNGRRFDPVLQMLSGRDLRTFQLTGWGSFLGSTNNIPATLSIRELGIDVRSHEEWSEHTPCFIEILQASPMLTKVNVRAANGFKTVLDPLAASLEQCKLSQGLTLVMTVLPNKMKHLEFSEASVEFEAGWGGFRDTHLADLVDRCISTATQVMQLPQDHESLADQLVVQDLRAQTHQRLRICLCNVYVTDNYIKEQNERLARLGLGWIRLEREAR